jgi:hypothetical protein
MNGEGRCFLVRETAQGAKDEVRISSSKPQKKYIGIRVQLLVKIQCAE